MPGSNGSQSPRAKPFIKWVGGKGQLLGQLGQLLPSDLSSRKQFDYREPFVGGGAMLFFMLCNFPNIRSATINDLNKNLVTAYTAVRDSPEELISLLSEQQSKYRECPSEVDRKEFYLSERARYNAQGLSSVETAALFIFLNRTCFNGLHRVNSRGLFNVPFGRSTNPLICDEETIRADSALLQKVEILNGDFEATAIGASPGTFFYFDPPYRPLTQTSSFTAYAADGFDDKEQKRLADFCRPLKDDWSLDTEEMLKRAESNQCGMIFANPNDSFFEEAFDGFDINRVSASRMINSKADGRGKISELAIRNYRKC